MKAEHNALSMPHKLAGPLLPYQGMGNLVLDPFFHPAEPDFRVICDEQLGGLIRSYRRAAA